MRKLFLVLAFGAFMGVGSANATGGHACCGTKAHKTCTAEEMQMCKDKGMKTTGKHSCCKHHAHKAMNHVMKPKA